MTSADVVRRALQRLGVVAHNKPATADQISRGIETLNDMLANFKLAGADLEHVELGQRDNLALPAHFNQAVIACLATELMPEYPGSAAPDSRKAYSFIQANYVVVGNVDLGVTTLTERDEWYDFDNG